MAGGGELHLCVLTGWLIVRRRVPKQFALRAPWNVLQRRVFFFAHTNKQAKFVLGKCYVWKFSWIFYCVRLERWSRAKWTISCAVVRRVTRRFNSPRAFLGIAFTPADLFRLCEKWIRGHEEFRCTTIIWLEKYEIGCLEAGPISCFDSKSEEKWVKFKNYCFS